MSDVDDAIASARASWTRIAEDYRGPGATRPRGGTGGRRAAQATLGTRIALIGAANAVILIAAVVVGMAMPLGLFGALLVLLLMVVVTLAIALAPAQRAPSSGKLAQVDIRALPAQTERWLGAQRPMLPAPAQALVDRIGERLDTLSPQLVRVEPDTPDAQEIRRLIGEQLPAFVDDYARVPQPLRGTARGGKTPDAELADGLRLIESEIADMTRRLAQGDMDSLATRGRFLELKYRGDGEV